MILVFTPTLLLLGGIPYGLRYTACGSPLPTVGQTVDLLPTAGSTSEDQSFPGSGSTMSAGVIAGATIGGIVQILIVTAAVTYCCVRCGRRKPREARVLDIDESTVEVSSNPQLPTFSENTVPTPYIHQHAPQSDQSSTASSHVPTSSTSLIPQVPRTAQEKLSQLSSRPSPQSTSTTSAARADELTAGRDISSEQVDVVRTLVDRNVPGETISRVIEMMVAGQPVPNTMEGHDLRQGNPSIEPPPQYSATPRRL